LSETVRTSRKQIPRPAGWHLGADAPWSASPHPVVCLEDVRRAFAGQISYEGKEAGTAREAFRAVTALELPATAGSRPAAVLCLLFEEAGEANVVLTRRAAHLRSHAGEVSFPGGRLRPGEDPVDAALREAYEEVGARVPRSSVIGELTPLTTYRSPALVYCYVATFPGPGSGSQALLPQVSEVERVFWAPLSRLAGVFHEELWPAPSGGGAPGAESQHRAVPFFVLDEDVVWGATGRLVMELLTRVLVAPRPSMLPGR